MKTPGALITIMPALLAVVCLQSSSTEAQENTEARLSAAVSAAAPLTFELSQKTTEATADGRGPCRLDPRTVSKRAADASKGE